MRGAFSPLFLQGVVGHDVVVVVLLVWFLRAGEGESSVSQLEAE